MGGDNHTKMGLDRLGADKACSGTCNGCGCGCGCGCDQCVSRLKHDVDSGANRNHHNAEGGNAHEQGVPTLPIDIATTRYGTMTPADASFEEDIVGPNDALQMAGASQALTRANITNFTHSYDNANQYQEDWLNRHRRDVDENPALYFLTPDDTETFEDGEGFFGRMEPDSSSLVEDSVAGDTTRSNHSRMTCSRSHSSSASQVLAGLPTPGFVFRPLPLLPCVHLPELQEDE